MRETSPLVWLMPLGLLLFAILFVPARILDAEGLPRYRALRAELQQTRQNNARMRRQVHELTQQVARLRNDPQAIERIARDELGMLRSDGSSFSLHSSRVRATERLRFAGFLTRRAAAVYWRREAERRRGSMTALVQAALTVRRGARGAFGYFAAFGLGLLVVLGLFRQQKALGVEHAVVFAAWAVVLAARVHSRVREQRRDETRNETQSWLDFEIALLLLPAAHALLQMAGGLSSPLYPLMYAFVAFIAAFAERRVTRLFVPCAIGFEAALYFATEAHADPQPFVLHAGLLLLFALLNTTFTRAEISRVRLRSQRELRDEKQRVSADARLLPPGRRADRLIAARRRAAHAFERRGSASGAVFTPRSAQAHAAPARLRAADVDETARSFAWSSWHRQRRHRRRPVRARLGRGRRSVQARPDHEPRAPAAGLSRALLLPAAPRASARSSRCRCRDGRACAACCAPIASQDEPFTPAEEDVLEARRASTCCARSRTSACSCSSSAASASRPCCTARRRRSARR